jgi:hypothetical protein
MLFDACAYSAVPDELQCDKIERPHRIPRGALYFYLVQVELDIPKRNQNWTFNHKLYSHAARAT